MSVTLAFCTMLPMMVDDISQQRRDGVPAQAVYSMYQEVPVQAAIALIYAMPKDANHTSVKAQMVLNCKNEEVLNGYQYQNERADWGTRGSASDELGSGECAVGHGPSHPCETDYFEEPKPVRGWGF